MTAHDRLRMHLAQAYTRVENEDACRHVRAAIEACDDLPPTPLVECPVCARVGLPERIAVHRCQEE